MRQRADWLTAGRSAAQASRQEIHDAARIAPGVDGLLDRQTIGSRRTFRGVASSPNRVQQAEQSRDEERTL